MQATTSKAARAWLSLLCCYLFCCCWRAESSKSGDSRTYRFWSATQPGPVPLGAPWITVTLATALGLRTQRTRISTISTVKLCQLLPLRCVHVIAQVHSVQIHPIQVFAMRRPTALTLR